MLFRNIVFSAVVVGLFAGLLYGAFQQYQVNPIIYAAEAYEVEEEEGEGVVHQHADGSAHVHGGEAWGPEDGGERIFYTMLANVVTAISFALIMISLMALHNHKSSKPHVNAVYGIAWGIAGLLSIFAAPALFGLHPEVPGTVAAALENRQMWWIFCALATALGIAVLYYAPLKIKLLGVVIAALPHIVGPPMPESHGFANTDPVAVEALTQLSHQLYLMTAIGMTLFFILIGLFSGYAVKKFVSFDEPSVTA